MGVCVGVVWVCGGGYGCVWVCVGVCGCVWVCVGVRATGYGSTELVRVYVPVSALCGGGV